MVIGLVAIGIALPRAQAGAAKSAAGSRQGGVPEKCCNSRCSTKLMQLPTTSDFSFAQSA